MPTSGLERTEDGPNGAVEGLPDFILDVFGERFGYLSHVFHDVRMIFEVWSPIWLGGFQWFRSNAIQYIVGYTKIPLA